MEFYKRPPHWIKENLTLDEQLFTVEWMNYRNGK